MKIDYQEIHIAFALHTRGMPMPKLAKRYGVTERALYKRFAKLRLDKRDHEHRRAN
jgi:DNA-binding NtrC family response regulator